MERDPHKPRTFIVKADELGKRFDVKHHTPKELLPEEIEKEVIFEPLILKYIIMHQNNDLDEFVNNTLKNLYETSSIEFDEISEIFATEIITIEKNEDTNISIIEIDLFNCNDEIINGFQKIIIDNEDFIEVCKTYDSYKLKENQQYLGELHKLEMKIREIFTVLTRLQGVRINDYEIIIRKDYIEKKEIFKKQLMNEFFFIEFSSYKNINNKKTPKFTDFLDVIRNVESLEELKLSTNKLINHSLELDERFNEATRIPEAIGRLEGFRNDIAHNRYLSSKSIENFSKAKEIIDDVYDNFRIKCINRDI